VWGISITPARVLSDHGVIPSQPVPAAKGKALYRLLISPVGRAALLGRAML